MKCPKCGWQQIESATRDVKAKKPNGDIVMLTLTAQRCLRHNCSWYYQEKYKDRLEELHLLPIGEV